MNRSFFKAFHWKLCVYLLLGGFWVSSCGNSNNSTKPTDETQQDSSNYFSTKAYYYPVEELAAGKVYEYVMLHDNEAYVSHYWMLQSEVDDAGNTFLIWKRFNPALQQDQYIKEWIVNDGVITKAYELYIQDSTGKVETYTNKIEQNVVFPFQASTDSVMAYRFSCEMRLPPDFLTVKLVRDRKFSRPTSYVYAGDTLDAVIFTAMDFYDLEQKEEGGFWQQKEGVVEVYAKGIGLVYEESRTAGDSTSTVTRLNKTYSVPEFQGLQLTG